jgi:hypothetical protein
MPVSEIPSITSEEVDIIDWDLEPPKEQQIVSGIKKCPACWYTTNDNSAKICPYERDIVFLS